MTTWLSPHFALEELMASQTASREGLDNTPPPEALANLRITAHKMEAVRALLAHPILVSSGYRSPAVNKAAHGAINSAHMTGNAVDFTCWTYGDPLTICRMLAASALMFDQVIQEGTWVHISFDPRNRRQVFTKTPAGYSHGLQEAA